MNETPKPAPKLEDLQKVAKDLITEKLLNKGGTQPSPEAVEIASRLMAAKALRIYHARQGEDKA